MACSILLLMEEAERLAIRFIAARDRAWVEQLTTEHWSAPFVVSRGRIHRPAELPGLIAECGSQLCGMLTFHIQDADCEIVTLVSLVEGIGIGGALIEAVHQIALQAGCRRLWLITTNDNLPALRFYQKRGFHLVTIYRNALEATRALKPSVPELGMEGIPIRDEIELELLLSQD